MHKITTQQKPDSQARAEPVFSRASTIVDSIEAILRRKTGLRVERNEILDGVQLVGSLTLAISSAPSSNPHLKLMVHPNRKFIEYKCSLDGMEITIDHAALPYSQRPAMIVGGMIKMPQTIMGVTMPWSTPKAPFFDALTAVFGYSSERHFNENDDAEHLNNLRSIAKIPLRVSHKNRRTTRAPFEVVRRD